MKEIAVIIPVYNAHKTIRKTLCSVSVQLNKNFTVYLSVDGEQEGSYDYLYDSFPDLDMKILYSPVNRGAGGARQYAMDNTFEPYITFIDSDDIFSSASSISILRNAMEENDVMVSSPFWREQQDGSFKLKSVSILTWLHGKMYRRSFLDKYKIRFNEEYTNTNEDVGFNTQCHLIADCVNERIKQLTADSVYIQLDNSNSLTRMNNNEFVYKKSFEGFVMNKLHAHKHALSILGEFDDDIKESIIRSIVHIYINYYGIHQDNEYYVETFKKYSKIFIDELYPYVKDYPVEKTIRLEIELVGMDDIHNYLKWKKSVIS